MTPLTVTQTAVLDALTTHGRPILLEEFRADSCIASTKIGIEVLAYFGMRSEPLPIAAMLFNAEAVGMLEQGTAMEELRSVMAAIPLDAPGGPWSLGLGAGGYEPGMWAGHLVIALPQHQTIVDLSADQAARPHKNLNLEPFHAVIDSPLWWTGEDPVATFTGTDGSTLILDRRAPDPEGYRTSPNWQASGATNPSLYKSLTGRIIRAVKAAL